MAKEEINDLCKNLQEAINKINESYWAIDADENAFYFYLMKNILYELQEKNIYPRVEYEYVFYRKCHLITYFDWNCNKEVIQYE